MIKICRRILIGMFIILICMYTKTNNVKANADDVTENNIQFNELQRYYDKNNNFIINILSDITINEYYYDEANINVISTIIEDNKLTLELNINTVEQYSKLEITIDNKTIILFTYNTNEYIFTSSISKDDSFENYISFMYENNYISSSQLKEQRLEYYRNASINEEIIHSNSNDSNMSTFAVKPGLPGIPTLTPVVINGTISWIDDYNITRPCQFVKVEVYTKYDVLINAVKTNEKGEFSLNYSLGTNSSAETLSDIYILIYAGNSDAILKSQYDNEYIWTTKNSANANITGNIKTINVSFPMNDANNEANDFGRAMQISQAVITATNYAKEMVGEENILPVNVVYPNDNDNCFYSPTDAIIYIKANNDTDNFTNKPRTYASWDVIMHEYGHHFTDMVGLDDSPGGTHFSSQNMFEHYLSKHLNATAKCDSCGTTSPNFSSDSTYKEHALKLVWSEGVATFFSLVAQQYYIDILDINKLDDDLTNDDTPNIIETVGDECYTAYNNVNVAYEDSGITLLNQYRLGITNDSNIDRYRLGEGNEASITYFLYNMYDDLKPSNNDLIDYYNLDHEMIWYYLIDSESVKLSEFVNYLYTVEYINETALEILLTKSNIAAKPQFININNELATFKWAQPINALYYKNIFKIEISDENYDIILTINDLTDNVYALEDYEWNIVLNSVGRTFNWRVIVEEHTGDITGPYISCWRTENKLDTDKILVLSDSNEPNAEITYSKQYEWFKFTALEDGIYSFYTEGYLDTVGYLFNNMMYGLTTLGNIANNDNAEDDNNNFKITYQLSTGQTVYLRVHTNNYDDSPYTLKLDLIEHIHNYTYSYVSIDEISHICYCICGEAKKNDDNQLYYENHIFQLYTDGYICVKCGYFTMGPIIDVQNIDLIISEEDMAYIEYKKEEFE